MDLSTSKVFVTGGAGLVGSHIVDELVREGASVIVYDSFVRGIPTHLEWARENGDVHTVEGDLRDVEKLKETMAGSDYAFHQAAMWLLSCEADPRAAVEVNIIGTFNVLEACVEVGIKKVVAASSSSVYGDGTYFPTDESHPFNNDLFYGATKVADEQLLRAFHKKYGLDYIGFRYLNVYGPRQQFDSAYMDVINHFLNRIDAGESPVIHGDGTQTLDLVFVEDVARANIAALRSDITNEFFNVASGVETSLNELAHILLELKGRDDITPVYEPRDSKLVSRRYGCPKKANEILGFEVSVEPREGLRRVIEWRERVKSKDKALTAS